MPFVDTNVLIYAVNPDQNEIDKQRIAQSLLENEDLTLSVQVLQEFYHQVTRHNRPAALSHTQALRFIEQFAEFPVMEMTLEIVYSAATISNRYQLSYWDGAILAAAKAAGCDVVYSEDMSHMQDYDGVRVVNPFSDL